MIDNSKVLVKSPIPEYVDLGNLNFHKKFDEAIRKGEELLKKEPNSAGVHVNLMISYFKTRNENPENIFKCINHAKLAMLNGHNTGFVQNRLCVSLEKLGKINQAMQVCNIVLSDKFTFSKTSGGKKQDYVKRREILFKKLIDALDNDSPQIFDEYEIEIIYNNISA